MLSLLEPEDDHARDVRGVFETRCTADRWPADVRTCILGTTSLKGPKHCKARLSIAVRSHLETDLAAAGARARERQVPDSCRAYARTVDQIMTCDQMPQAARAAMRQGYETLRTSWSSLEGDARAAAAASCQAAAEAMRQAASAMGCALL